MRNINLTKDNFFEKLEKYLKDNKFNYKIDESPKPNNSWTCTITIAGNKPFIYAIYDTSKGLTVVPQGQNIEMANKILAVITSDTEIVEHKSKTFIGIIPSVFDKIKEYYINNKEYNILENKCSRIQINLSIIKNRQKVTIQYYPTTQKAILAGQSTYLWNEVFVELTSHLNINAKDIVSLYLKDKEEMQSLSITYDEGILDEYIKCQLTNEVYSNTNLITEIERKWLKTSAFLVFTEIQLPEYFASIASAIKIIEGLLNRICIEYNLPQCANFDYFEPDKQTTIWKLKPEYENNFNNKKIIQTVNDLYNFIHNNRHKLYHNDGINPEQVTQKSKAIAIFKDIITLLIQTHESSVL